jgi:hypothetical protein
LQEGGVTLEEASQIQIPWTVHHPTMPEKSWEVFEELDSVQEDADKILKFVKKDKS